MENRTNRALHIFAVFTAVSTFALIIAGGLVTSTGSGLAVPDWPLSYGQLMPPMVGGIFYEHGHRMVATFVGLLTVVLALWLWRKEERRWLRVLGFIALVAVIAQGVLGGLTVLFLLPTAVSVSHATLAQTFFCLVSAIALFTSPWWTKHQRSEPTSRPTHRLVALSITVTAAIFVQLILGALNRHTDSGLAVPDFPLAYSQLFPRLSAEALEKYNAQLLADNIRIYADGPIAAGQILLHMAHRLWGIVVVVLVLWLAVRLRKDSPLPHLRTFGLTIGMLAVVQVGLGGWTVLSRKAVDITTAHVATGALLLVGSLLIALQLVRLADVRLPLRVPVFTRGAEA